MERRPWIQRDAKQCIAVLEGLDSPPKVSKRPLYLLVPLHLCGLESNRCFDILSYDDEILEEKVLSYDKGGEFQ